VVQTRLGVSSHSIATAVERLMAIAGKALLREASNATKTE